MLLSSPPAPLIITSAQVCLKPAQLEWIEELGPELDVITEVLRPFYNQIKHHHLNYHLPVYAMSFSKPKEVTKLTTEAVLEDQGRDCFNAAMKRIAEGTESVITDVNKDARYCAKLSVLLPRTSALELVASAPNCANSNS